MAASEDNSVTAATVSPSIIASQSNLQSHTTVPVTALNSSLMTTSAQSSSGTLTSAVTPMSDLNLTSTVLSDSITSAVTQSSIVRLTSTAVDSLISSSSLETFSTALMNETTNQSSVLTSTMSVPTTQTR